MAFRGEKYKKNSGANIRRGLSGTIQGVGRTGTSKMGKRTTSTSHISLTNMYIDENEVVYVTYDHSDGILPGYVKLTACLDTCAAPGACLYWIAGGYTDGNYSSTPAPDDGELNAPIPENSLPQTYSILPEWLAWFQYGATMHLSFQALDINNGGYWENDEHVCIDYVTGTLTGDLNDDGVVNVFDVLKLISYILDPNNEGEGGIHQGDPAYIAEYDINNSGSIDVGDIVALIQIILGRSSTTAADRKELRKQLNRINNHNPSIKMAHGGTSHCGHPGQPSCESIGYRSGMSGYQKGGRAGGRKGFQQGGHAHNIISRDHVHRPGEWEGYGDNKGRVDSWVDWGTPGFSPGAWQHSVKPTSRTGGDHRHPSALGRQRGGRKRMGPIKSQRRGGRHYKPSNQPIHLPQCPSGESPDCNGNCYHDPLFFYNQGNYECNDGTWGINLCCPEFNWDSGDCYNHECRENYGGMQRGGRVRGGRR